MKGLSLPINMIVIIAIAVLVLVVIAAFFTGQIFGGETTINREAAFQEACQSLRFTYNCDPDTVNSITTQYALLGTGTGAKANLMQVCNERNPTVIQQASSPERACANLCGCGLP